MKEKPNVNFNLSNQTYHRDKHMLSKPECTASYIGLFQTDFVMQFWFSLLRGATKIQEQVPSGSQKQRLPEELKWASLSWQSTPMAHPCPAFPTAALQQSPSQGSQQAESTPWVWCKPSPSFVPLGWGTASHWNTWSASSLWNTREKYHQVGLTHCRVPKQQLLSYPYRILPVLAKCFANFTVGKYY